MDSADNARYLARIGGLSALIVATLIDPKYFEMVIRSDVQVIVAAIVIFVTLFVDHILGFLLGLSALVIYSRVFMKKYGITGFGTFWNTYPMKSLVSDNYITEDNLKDAQSNVVDDAQYDEAYKGVDGVYGEEVYNAQGLEEKSILPGLGADAPVGQTLE